MCGIGRSAIYLCPNNKCRVRFNGLAYYKPTMQCQCGGEGFLGSLVCDNQGSCFEKYPGYYECTSSNSCPPGWACGRK